MKQHSYNKFLMHQKYLKYRAGSIRLHDFDYSRYGAYSITVCTYVKDFIFGYVYNSQMHLSDKGRIADTFWRRIPMHFPNAKLGRHVIMPNHLHGVLFMLGRGDFGRRDTACRVSTKKIIGTAKEAFSKPTIGTLPTIIRSYKAAVTRCLMIADLSSDNTIWQRGYYEHVIGDKKELWAINNYIKYNPKNWEIDDYYK